MNTAIDFRTLPVTSPSLCIPRVFSNIDERRIRKIFDDLDMGIIERVDIVRKSSEKGENFNRVFIHFRRWFANQNADTARERLLNGKEIKIIYDDPWFWKVSAYKPAASGHNPEQKKATIQFDSDDDIRYTDRKPVDNRRPDDIRYTDRKPVDRRPERRPLDRRPERRPNDNRRPVEKEKEKLIVTVKPEAITTPPNTEENFDDQIVNKCLQNAAAHMSHYDSQMLVPPPVVYDMNVVNSTKKRVIIKRETPPKDQKEV